MLIVYCKIVKFYIFWVSILLVNNVIILLIFGGGVLYICFVKNWRWFMISVSLVIEKLWFKKKLMKFLLLYIRVIFINISFVIIIRIGMVVIEIYDELKLSVITGCFSCSCRRRVFCVRTCCVVLRLCSFAVL